MSPSDPPSARVRRCSGCVVLLIRGRHCSCDAETVHLITELGPTGLPGRIQRAELARPWTEPFTPGATPHMWASGGWINR